MYRKKYRGRVSVLHQQGGQQPEKRYPYKTAVPLYKDRPGIVRHFRSSGIGELTGFGFIEVPGVMGQGRCGTVFVHESDIQGWGYPRLRPGDYVFVDIVGGRRGLQAVNVRYF